MRLTPRRVGPRHPRRLFRQLGDEHHFRASGASRRRTRLEQLRVEIGRRRNPGGLARTYGDARSSASARSSAAGGAWKWRAATALRPPCSDFVRAASWRFIVWRLIGVRMPAIGSYAKTTILLATLSAILVLIGKAFGGNQGMVIAFGFAIVMNGISYWFSDRIVLKMHEAKEVDPSIRFTRSCKAFAMRAKLPMPKVYVIPSPSPNAFATAGIPRTPR